MIGTLWGFGARYSQFSLAIVLSWGSVVGTARRAFEVAYWKTIATLAEGRFLNKNNADCVRDAVTQCMLPYHGRHLDR